MFCLSNVNVITSSCLTVSKYSYPQNGNFPIVKVLSRSKVYINYKGGFNFYPSPVIMLPWQDARILWQDPVQCTVPVLCITPCKPASSGPGSLRHSLECPVFWQPSASLHDNIQWSGAVNSSQTHSCHSAESGLYLHDFSAKYWPPGYSQDGVMWACPPGDLALLATHPLHLPLPVLSDPPDLLLGPSSALPEKYLPLPALRLWWGLCGWPQVHAVHVLSMENKHRI